MSRSRLLWFTFGFASTYVALYQTVLKDLTLQRHAFTSHTERYFRILEARLSNIEQSSSSSSVPAPNQNASEANDLACLDTRKGKTPVKEKLMEENSLHFFVVIQYSITKALCSHILFLDC
ncbi:hypothetical protein D0Y65_042527 [Glycine soja]|uniref:Uncharacterized protein n=1 Tax=Glycine soja TaxID=3848 RepID=A0A445GDH8_GLYSO|nr:hypothetical protein D0Y65_042527 [Glycine soja]